MSDATEMSRDDLAAEVVRLRTQLRQVRGVHETARVLIADNLWANRYRLQSLAVDDLAVSRPMLENIGREIVDALHSVRLITDGPVRDGDPCPRCQRPMYDYEVEPGMTIPACDCGP
jgi:hypothetical protein